MADNTSTFSSELYSNVSAVQYKPAENRQLKMLRYSAIQSLSHRALGRNRKSHFSDKCSANRVEVISMVTRFRSMWDGRLGCTSVVRHRIKLFEETTQPVHLVPYRAGPKIREFKKPKSEKMLFDKRINRVQTEQAASIILDRRRMDHYAWRWLLHTRRRNKTATRIQNLQRMDECTLLGRQQCFTS